MLIEIPSTLSKNKRGTHFKLALAEILKDLGFSVEIEKQFVIEGNAGNISVDLVVNNTLGIEIKMYIDTNMAYKYVAPIEDIQSDNDNAPINWATIVVQNAGGFSWLKRHNIACLAFGPDRDGTVVEQVDIDLPTLKQFINDNTN